jgi:glycosyltransferase 2 family protein
MHSQEANPEVQGAGNSFKHQWKLVLSYAFAALCMAWVLYNVHPTNLLYSIRNLKWSLVLLAIAVDNLNYLAQAIRWKFLLRPVVDISAGKSIQATYVGVFTSNVLPMRLGEIVRGYLVSKWYSKKFSSVIPSMVVEHLFEGIWLALGIFVAIFFIPIPPYVRVGAQLFVFGVIVLAGIFLYSLLRKNKPLPEPHRVRSRRNLAQKLGFFMGQMADGMKDIGLSFDFFVALFVTLISLLMQAMALWMVALACGIPVQAWESAVALIIIRVGVVIPNAPANIGAYQFFAALALEILGVNRSVAAGFAIFLFFISMIPTWIIGFFALSKSGTTLFRLQQDAKAAAKE